MIRVVYSSTCEGRLGIWSVPQMQSLEHAAESQTLMSQNPLRLQENEWHLPHLHQILGVLTQFMSKRQ